MKIENRWSGGLASVTRNGVALRRTAGGGTGPLKPNDIEVFVRQGAGEWKSVGRWGRLLADQQYAESLSELKAPRLTGVRMVDATGAILREHTR